jgi:hypothetical protein
MPETVNWRSPREENGQPIAPDCVVDSKTRKLKGSPWSPFLFQWNLAPYFGAIGRKADGRRSAWAVECFYFLEFWKTNLAPAHRWGLLLCGQTLIAALPKIGRRRGIRILSRAEQLSY